MRKIPAFTPQLDTSWIACTHKFAMGNAEERKKTQILLIDNEISVSEMLGIVLTQKGFAVADEAPSASEGLRLFKKFKPDLVISNVTFPDMEISEMIQTMRKYQHHVRLLIYTGSSNLNLIASSLETFPLGFVHKSEPLAMLCQAIELVTQGISFFSPYAGRALAGKRTTDQLTTKERSVLQLVAKGMSTKQVAGQLNLSPKTVEHYRIQLMQKLDLNNIASLTRYAVRCGLVRAE